MPLINCTNCGVPLDITEEIEFFSCSFCGAQQKVERKGGIVFLKKVESAIKAVQRGTDRTAAELAIPRLKQELDQLEVDRGIRVSKEYDDLTEELLDSKIGKITFTILIIFTLVFWLVIFANFFAESDSIILNVILSGIISLFALALILWVINTKIGNERISAINQEFDNKATRLREQIAANRKILD